MFPARISAPNTVLICSSPKITCTKPQGLSWGHNQHHFLRQSARKATGPCQKVPGKQSLELCSAGSVHLKHVGNCTWPQHRTHCRGREPWRNQNISTPKAFPVPSMLPQILPAFEATICSSRTHPAKQAFKSTTICPMESTERQGIRSSNNSRTLELMEHKRNGQHLKRGTW